MTKARDDVCGGLRMFRLLRLKPPHGWNAVAWELAIVTLGVVIALAAQQFVDAFHWRREVSGFRDAVRAELNENLATYTFRMKQNHCVGARLDELQRWLDSWRAGRPQRLAGPIGVPGSLVVRTSAWDSRDAPTLAHMSRGERIGYGFLYSEFANNEVHRLDERAAWIELATYDGATVLDHDDLMRLQGLITRARLRDRRITGNARRFFSRAAAMDLKPQADPTWPAPDPEMCRPILPKSGEHV